MEKVLKGYIKMEKTIINLMILKSKNKNFTNIKEPF